MKWLVKNYSTGEKVTWYSEEYVLKLKEALKEIKHNAEVQIECLEYEIKNDCFSQIRCQALQQQIDFIKEEILQEFTKLHEER